MDIGSLISMAGGAFLNKQSAKSQNKENRIASARQMAFQQQNSDTSYQRGMKDMKKAGLNPILAGKLGGASTPTGATYQASNADLAGGMQKGMSVATAQQQLKNQIEINKGQNIQNQLNQLDLDALKKLDLSPMQMKHTVFNQAGSELYNEAKQTYSNAKDVVSNSLDQTTGYFKTLARDIKRNLNTSAKESDILRIIINTKQYNESKRKFNQRLRNNK